MNDAFDLQRFVQAQDPVWPQVVGELQQAHKRSHWMWFVFPQMRGLGRSATAAHFGIASRAEALAYLDHALLGTRLRQAVNLLLQAPGELSAHAILGSPDDLKLHSSLTLFNAVAPAEPLFQQALHRYFGGRPDAATLALVVSQQAAGAISADR